MSAHYRSLGDLARNGCDCDAYGDLIHPEEEAPNPHFAPTEEDWRDYERWSTCPAPAVPTLVLSDFEALAFRTVGAMQGIAMQLNHASPAEAARLSCLLKTRAAELLEGLHRFTKATP
jgi:hypothetical protein